MQHIHRKQKKPLVMATRLRGSTTSQCDVPSKEPDVTLQLDDVTSMFWCRKPRTASQVRNLLTRSIPGNISTALLHELVVHSSPETCVDEVLRRASAIYNNQDSWVLSDESADSDISDTASDVSTQSEDEEEFAYDIIHDDDIL